MGALGTIAYHLNPWLIIIAIVPLVLAHRAIEAVVRWLDLIHQLNQANTQLAELNTVLELRVEARTADLARALRVKDDFLSIAAHELRTPLTSIVSSYELLIDTVAGSLPPPAQRLLGIAEKNSQRLARLISDILDLQKLDASQ